MILTYITMGLVIVGIVLLVVNDKCNGLLLVLGVTSLVLGILMGAVIGLVAIANHTAVDNQIYKKQMEYESITRQLQIIDSEYEDVSKA